MELRLTKEDIINFYEEKFKHDFGDNHDIKIYDYLQGELVVKLNRKDGG